MYKYNHLVRFHLNNKTINAIIITAFILQQLHVPYFCWASFRFSSAFAFVVVGRGTRGGDSSIGTNRNHRLRSYIFHTGALPSKSSTFPLFSLGQQFPSVKKTPLATTTTKITTSRKASSLASSSSCTDSNETMKPLTIDPPKNFRGLFVGSGSDGLNEPEITDAILSLARKSKTNSSRSSSNNNDTCSLNVLYVGTATYDLEGPKNRQTQRFVEAGCNVVSLDVTEETLSIEEMGCILKSIDIIVVSGGNTLFAVDRWIKIGLDTLLREALHRGTVLTGGSAGAICWFQGGHSDSMDPDSYKDAMLRKSKNNNGNKDESSEAPRSEKDKKSWEYIRVNGLGFLPGLLCPHHDKTQSNGVPRSKDFDDMLLNRYPNEVGIGIDHWAALEIDGEKFRVVSIKNKPGSVVDRALEKEESSSMGTTKVEKKKKCNDVSNDCNNSQTSSPGIWIKKVVQVNDPGDEANKKKSLQTMLCPRNGNVVDLIKLLAPQDRIIQDSRVEICRAQNPENSSGQ